MKRYRLLKDLPDIKAGEIGDVNEHGLLCFRIPSNAVTMPTYVFDEKCFLKSQDWFELIPEETKKERIKVRVDAIEGENYSVLGYTFKIDWKYQSKMLIIKEAIESILNDDKEDKPWDTKEDVESRLKFEGTLKEETKEFQWTDKVFSANDIVEIISKQCAETYKDYSYWNFVSQDAPAKLIASLKNFKKSKSIDRNGYETGMNWMIAAYRKGGLIYTKSESWGGDYYSINGIKLYPDKDNEIYSVKRLSDGEIFAIGDFYYIPINDSYRRLSHFYINQGCGMFLNYKKGQTLGLNITAAEKLSNKYGSKI